MKNIMLSVLTAILLMSCTSNKKEGPQAWTELQAFQELIQKPFQHLKDPSAMDSITLSITIENIKSIAEAAQKLADSPLPDKMNNEDIKAKLQKIRNESKALADEIAGGTEDDVIGTKIYSVYSAFVDVNTAWKNGE